MSTVLEERYLTIAEAADLLRVNPSTIRRWVAQGHLPASRLGQRRVVLKHADVAAMIAPLNDTQGDAIPRTPDGRYDLPPLTPEERERGLAALESAEKLQEEILERRGGKLFSPSWELLNEARDERTEYLP